MTTYGGMKAKEIRSLVKSCLREQDLGLDSILGDESKAAEIIRDLLDEVKRLKSELKGEDVKSKPKKQKKSKAKFPKFD